MGKIDTLQKYIDACDEKRNNPHDKYELNKIATRWPAEAVA